MKSENKNFVDFFSHGIGRQRVKMMKNAFYFIGKIFLKIFNFLSWLFFGHVAKRLGQEAVIFKIYDVMLLEN